jgi:NIMA-interacting peptidyl-prolyl cis-trans isomerase 1
MASADTLPPNKATEDDVDMFDDAATDGPASSIDGGNNNNTGTATDVLEKSVQQQLASNPPPSALPTGWFLKASQINAPGNYYYFNQDTGECCWELPASASSTSAVAAAEAEAAASSSAAVSAEAVSQESLNATAAAAAAAVKSILKRVEPTAATENNNATITTSTADNNATQVKSSRKKQKTDEKEKHREKHHSSSSSSPKEVRVLHILKKHKDSRRPASWRNPKITDTKQKAISDLQELLSILTEVSSNPKELRATFEELAKTESDCSSAKRGGDLGFFGRKKMQPAFEKASFGLKVGELTSEVVDTSSGVHIILRLA